MVTIEDQKRKDAVYSSKLLYSPPVLFDICKELPLHLNIHAQTAIHRFVSSEHS